MRIVLKGGRQCGKTALQKMVVEKAREAGHTVIEGPFERPPPKTLEQTLTKAFGDGTLDDELHGIPFALRYLCLEEKK